MMPIWIVLLVINIVAIVWAIKPSKKEDGPFAPIEWAVRMGIVIIGTVVSWLVYTVIVLIW